VQSAGTLADVPGVPDDIRRLFVTAREIAPEWHVRIQAAFQHSTELGVSKTINLPNGATPDDVDRVLRLAHQTGCKGITVYRDGSRDTQFLVAGGDAGVGEVCPSCPT
jgi:ribonucleoside-diphosphate reductase alpha chain